MELLLFGIVREIVGSSTLTVPADAAIRDVGSLKSWLSIAYPEFGKLTALAVAVDNEYAEDNNLLNEQSEIALIPPVSGG